MLQLIDEVRALAGGVSARRVVLAGFSLGAVAAMDVTLQRSPGEVACRNHACGACCILLNFCERAV